MNKTLLILGAGGHGKSVAEAALIAGNWSRVIFLDDAWPSVTKVLGCDVVGKITDLVSVAKHCHGAIAAIGSNSVRREWTLIIEKANVELISIVHPRAWVSSSVKLQPGTAVLAGAVVGVDAKLGKGTILNAGVVVDHDAQLGDFVHLGVGVKLAGGVVIEDDAWLQAGCCAGYNVVVPRNQVLAPGTVLSV